MRKLTSKNSGPSSKRKAPAKKSGTKRLQKTKSKKSSAKTTPKKTGEGKKKSKGTKTYEDLKEALIQKKGPIDFGVVHDAYEYMLKAGLVEFEIKNPKFGIKLKFPEGEFSASPRLSIPQALSSQSSASHAEIPTENPVPAKPVEVVEKKNTHVVTSPFVGTFYRSPGPSEGPFVEVGKTIKNGEALCIIEAMKLMNEIESDTSGRIVKILVEDGTPVEFGEPLFEVER